MLELTHGRDYFSPSQLKKLVVSMSAFRSYLAREFKVSKAMDFGTLVHSLILEPDTVMDKYVVLDDAEIIKEIGGKRPTSTKKYAEFLSDFKKQAGTKMVVSRVDWGTAMLIVDKVEKLGLFDDTFVDGIPERKYFNTVKGFSHEFKGHCIIDYDRPDMSIDLKTTSKPLSKFRFDANEFGYDIQASLTRAMNGKDFYFVVVQTVEPFDVGFFSCSEAFLKRGDMKIQKAINRYRYHDGNIFNDELHQFEL